MKKLQRIGYWNDGIDRQDFIWPQELQQESPVQDAEEVAKYLEDGVVAFAWAGYSACRICNKLMGTTCKTDGVYVWPEKLEHYVIDHNVELPEPFLSHIRGNRYHIPGKVNALSMHYSDSWWKTWCSANRNHNKTPFYEEPFPLPKESDKATVLDAHVISEMFGLIERMDVLVSVLEVPSLSNFEPKFKSTMMEKFRGRWQLWSAQVTENMPHIKAASDEFIIAVVYVEPHFYCSYREMMYIPTENPKRYCPELYDRHEAWLKSNKLMAENS